MLLVKPLIQHLRLLAIALSIGLASCSPDTPAAPASSLHVEVGFSCRWWSQAQMEGLNPNHPPPQNTEVKLTRREYSDPVGTPHPDLIDVVITLRNAGGEPRSNLRLEVTTKWKDGPLLNEKLARLGPVSTLKTIDHASLPANETQIIRLPLDLKSAMATRAKKGLWPYSLQAKVKVFAAGSPTPLTEATADLPIHPGD